MIHPEDEEAIRQLGAAWDKAWNTHDMRALALLVSPTVDFIHVLGGWLGGREAFERYHARLHETRFKTSSTQTQGMTIKPLAQDVCVVHRNWRMTGEQGPEGSALPSRDGIITWIVRREGAKWLIEAAHNTTIQPGIVGSGQRKPMS
jgi:uncharacterized protein (TIGR02246 family)